MAHQPHDLLPVIVEHRKMANPTKVHDVVGERELVVLFQGGNLRRHDVANPQPFHA
ncbi:MAG: hypothetical protein WB580_03205 [Candidatus Binataceae bacterium]